MSEKSEAAAMLGRLGGKARARKHSTVMLAEWAALGGEARAAKHTKAELRAFARNAGRKRKLSERQWRRLFRMLRRGKTQSECSVRFGISTRTISRRLARDREGD
jgi:DNA-binding CsgD family transcriptional regulator